MFNSSYGYTLSNDKLAIVSSMVFGAFMFLYAGIWKRRLIRKSVLFSPFLLLAIWIVFSTFIHRDMFRWGSYLRQALLLVIAVLVVSVVRKEEFAKLFIAFMKFVTLVSICAWIAANLFKLGLPLPIIRAQNEAMFFPDYYNGFIFFMNTHHVFRLMGPFWEGGIYACSALMALIIQDAVLFETEKKKRRTMLCLLVGIALSFSTTGYMLTALFFLFKLLRQEKCYQRMRLSIAIAVGAILILLFSDQIISLLATLLPSVFGKLTYANASNMTRFNGPIVDLQIFADKPIFGAGFYEYERLWDIYAGIYQVESRTSSLTYFLACFGLTGILYAYAVLHGIFRQRGLPVVCRCLLALIMIGMITTAPYYINLISLLLISYYEHTQMYAINKKVGNA